MQTPSEKTSRMLLSTEQELFDRIVDAKHPFRRLNEIIDFPALIEPMRGGEPNQRRTSGSATNATPPWACATDS